MVLFQREAVYSLFSKGMAHFDTHQVGCVEGRAIRRCGGEGTRAYAITLHTTQLHTTTQLSLRSWIAWAPSRSPSGCLERGFNFLRPMTHTTHARATLTHPQNTTITSTKGTTHFDTHQMGCVEGRVVRRGGGGHPRQHDHSTHHTPATISHKSGVAKKQAQVWCLMTTVCGDAILA